MLLLLCALSWVSCQGQGLNSALVKDRNNKGMGCNAKCYKNKQPWINKCVWKGVCAACPECPLIRRCAKFCPTMKQTWPTKCEWDTCNGCSQCPKTTTTRKPQGGGKCTKDGNCPNGFYCSSKLVCVKYTEQHCKNKLCGLGDGDCDNNKECRSGLRCGNNNCALFHKIGAATGMKSDSDCCEGRPTCKLMLCRPWCKTKPNSWDEKCDWKDCCNCPQCPDSTDIKDPARPVCNPKKCESFCAVKSQPWGEKCSWKDCCACSPCGGPNSLPQGPDSSNTGTKCRKDSDCANGSYCMKKKVCVKFDREHCEDNMCGLGDGDCDANDNKGCAPGLTCGENNCAKFHELGAATGMQSDTDCCEGAITKPTKNTMARPFTCTSNECRPHCVLNKQAWNEKCNWNDCCACNQCGGPTKRPTKITKRPAASSVLYPSCKTDKHCAKNNQFCAKECFTGACGTAKVPLGTKRSFCQPCKECQRGADAMAGNCNKCRARARAQEKSTTRAMPSTGYATDETTSFSASAQTVAKVDSTGGSSLLREIAVVIATGWLMF